MKSQLEFRIKKGLLLAFLSVCFLSFASVGHSDLNPAASKGMTLQEIQALLTNRLITQKSEFVYIPHLSSHILSLCEKHKLDPAVVFAFIQSESSFRTFALSHVGAIGLMQVMPKTAKYLSKKYKIEYKNPKDLYNVYINSELGITYIAELRKRFKNDYHFIASYNWGPTKINQEIRENEFRIQDKQKYVKGILKSIPNIKLQAKKLNSLAAL